MMLLKPLFQCLSPADTRARLSVLIFHRVLAEPDLLFPDDMHARRFDEVCGWLKSWFNVLPLDEAVARLKTGSLPARAACITFDDGYADNHHVALPILQRHGLTATFFIATGFLDGGRMWNDTLIESIRACSLPVFDLSTLGLGLHALGSLDDRRAALTALIALIKYQSVDERIAITDQLAQLACVRPPDNLMMTSNEVKAMRHAGMQIGAHTVSHPILARLADEQARQEIEGSKRFLEQLLSEHVGLFAYPNGKPGEDYTAPSVALVRSLGFDAAVSTQWGASCMGDDLFQIRRFTPWDQTRLRFGARLLANLRGSA
jgi:peptidoglycan/xylan/chitin deacetylase (PgdA/CDA1 family)